MYSNWLLINRSVLIFCSNTLLSKLTKYNQDLPTSFHWLINSIDSQSIFTSPVNIVIISWMIKGGIWKERLFFRCYILAYLITIKLSYHNMDKISYWGQETIPKFSVLNYMNKTRILLFYYEFSHLRKLVLIRTKLIRVANVLPCKISQRDHCRW